MWNDACLPTFLKVRQVVNWEYIVFPDKKYNVGNKKIN